MTTPYIWLFETADKDQKLSTKDTKITKEKHEKPKPD